MKTFATYKSFFDALTKGLAWEDEMRVNGLVYQIYEYGPGPGSNLGYDYVYFLNKRTGNMLYIKYDCPAFQYVDGERIQSKHYSLHEAELQDYSPSQWH